MQRTIRSLGATLALALASTAMAQGEPARNDAAAAVSPPALAASAALTLAEPRADESNAQRARTQPGNNAPFWRGVRESGKAPGSVNNMAGGERGVLVQEFTDYPGSKLTTAGEAWRQVRNRWIIPYGGALLLITFVAIALYYFTKGPIRQHQPNTGRLIERFTYFERAAHWSNAIAFGVLALSGLVLAFGKYLMLPLMGSTLFGWLSYALKTVHNFAGPLFAVSMVVVFFTFLRSNWPSRDDFVWLRSAGGMLGGAEPPSHRFNAGEKFVFWGGVFVLGSIVIASGLVLDQLLPGLNYLRGDMQVAHIVHAVSAMLIMALFLGHTYMGTIGLEGSYQAMKTGYVDEGWALDHHRLWHDDVRDGKIPAQRSAPRAPRRELPAA